MAKFEIPQEPTAPEWVSAWQRTPEGKAAKEAYEKEIREKRDELLAQQTAEKLRHDQEIAELAEQDAKLKAERDKAFQAFQAAERRWCAVRNEMLNKGTKHDRVMQAIGRQLRELPEDSRWKHVSAKLERYREQTLKTLEGVGYQGKLEINQTILDAARKLDSLDKIDEFFADLQQTVEAQKDTWRAKLKQAERREARLAAQAEESECQLSKV